MKTFFAREHLAHAPKEEFEAGSLTPAVEIPARAEAVRARIEARKLGPIVPQEKFDDAIIRRVHDGAFVDFLTGAHASWIARYGENAVAAIPSCWPARGLRERRAGDIETQLGSYAFDTATPITKGTWQAARAAADVALTAAQAIASGEASRVRADTPAMGITPAATSSAAIAI